MNTSDRLLLGEDGLNSPSVHPTTPTADLNRLSGRESLNMSDLNSSTKRKSSFPNSSNLNSSKKIVSPLMEKLNAVKHSVQSFNGGFIEDINCKKEVEQTKVFELRDAVTRLEKDLTLEMRKRSDGDKVIQTICDNKINTVQDMIDKRLTERFAQMQMSVDGLTKRVFVLEKMLADERDMSNKFTTTMKTGVQGQLEELKAMIEDERLNRLEKETQMTRRMNEEYSKISQRVEFEKKARENFMVSTREDVQRIEEAKAKIDKDFRTQLFDEVDVLREDLRQEKENREAIDEQIVASLDSIIKQVQDSLRMVSK